MMPCDRADAYLEELGALGAKIRELEARAEAEIQAVRAKYGPKLDELHAHYRDVEKDLIGLMKSERSAIFRQADKVVLQNGTLLHAWEERVRIPRNALEKIEAAGWTEAIRVVKTLDRQTVESWPVERLAAIGADRKKQEVFKYELRSTPPSLLEVS